MSYICAMEILICLIILAWLLFLLVAPVLLLVKLFINLFRK